jgi:hypothetical protein
VGGICRKSIGSFRNPIDQHQVIRLCMVVPKSFLCILSVQFMSFPYDPKLRWWTDSSFFSSWRYWFCTCLLGRYVLAS